MIDAIVTFQDESIFDDVAINKTPNVTNGKDFMCLVRVDGLDNVPEGCEILGSYDEVFADEAKKAIYDSIHIQNMEIEDEDGNVINIILPEKFGVFA